jgi:CheY-like chemotaxis protein
MTIHKEPILVVSDNEGELEEIKQHLSGGYSQVYEALNEDAAVRCFEKKRVALLLLAMNSLHKAETFYLKLFHSSEHIYEIPHQVIVFVTRSELERAYELCLREIFHSFVIIRPLLSEHFLRLAVRHALEKRDSHTTIQRGRKLLQRLAEHVEHMRSEFDQLMADNKVLREQQHTAQRGLASSINSRLGIFRDSLMEPEMQKIVTVHDFEALHREFERLRGGEIISQLEYYHDQMDMALDSWTGNLEKQLNLLELASADANQAKQTSTPQILIIDDDAIQRHMLSSVLEEEGYAVLQAANGNEGMGMLLAKTPDLVLLDYEMPDLDGISLLRKARMSPQLKNLPVIMLTGHSEKEVVQLCLNHGANDYLVKPVKVERLREHLGQFLPRPVPA